MVSSLGRDESEDHLACVVGDLIRAIRILGTEIRRPMECPHKWEMQ